MDMSADSTGCGSDVAAYALGALPEEEARRFEAHLAECELCRSDLAGLRPVVQALPAAAEPVRPPPELRARIMKVVEAEAREKRARARAERRRSRFGFLSLRPVPALAAACVALLAGVAIGIGLLSGDDARTYEAQILRGGGSVELVVDDDRGRLQIRGMPQAPPQRVYQLWTQRDGEDPRPTDALFTVDRDGSASVAVPGDLGGVDRILATDEPPRGSMVPSTPPYFAVAIA
jgi:anti-sigma-K factor RskA